MQQPININIIIKLYKYNFQILVNFLADYRIKRDDPSIASYLSVYFLDFNCCQYTCRVV